MDPTPYFLTGAPVLISSNFAAQEANKTQRQDCGTAEVSIRRNPRTMAVDRTANEKTKGDGFFSGKKARGVARRISGMVGRAEIGR